MKYYKVQVANRNVLLTYSSNIEIEKGTFCIVELGKSRVEAVVISEDNNNYNFEIKEIIEILDKKLDKTLFSLIEWIHSYYLEPYSSLIPMITEPDEEKLDNNSIKKEININYNLSKEQLEIAEDIENSEDRIHLINGITGSGKTLVYIELMKRAMNEGKSSIMLVPEISLTPQFMSRLENIFGDEIAIWHSKLTKKKKYEYYTSLVNGEKKILLGTRSALFCKIKNLKYIFVDEEHESTYKQESSPRYHVKNVAIKRAILENAKVVLGSATPSFETYYQVERGLIKEHKLDKRYNNASIPTYEIVDLNNQEKMLNDKLIQAINDRIEKKEQVMILLNRKAHSYVIKCLDCSNIESCIKCTYKLSYYSSKNILKCNQCEYTTFFKDVCRKCSSHNLKKLGLGTEKLEEQLSHIFDENRILRMDSASMNTNKKIEKAYKDFLNKKYDLIVGTQIIAKGFHFPDVTLVCVINVDQMLSVQDYKMQERVYQLLVQASGRAGREEKKGTVIIQTYNPDSTLIKAVVNNDYKSIYTKQMELRRALSYPPYSKNIKIQISNTKEDNLNKASYEIHSLLVKYLSKYARIYPVSRPIIYMVSNRYRNIINLLFAKEEENKIKKIISNILDKYKTNSRINVDVDPTSML